MKCDYCGKKVMKRVQHGTMKICEDCSNLLNYQKTKTIWKGIEIN